MEMKKPIFTIIILTTLIASATMAYSSQTHTTHAQTLNTPTLTITGLVQNPQNLTLAQIEAMPQTSEYAELYCVDAPDSPLIEGNWIGVQLSYLLQLANVSPQAIKVAFYATDNYTTDLTVMKATNDNTVLVAYQENGAPLNGLRLVVPNCFGYKWINNLTQISLVDYNFLGTNELGGYSDEAGVTDVRGIPDTVITPAPTIPPNPTAMPLPTNPPATSASHTPSSVQIQNATAPHVASYGNSKPMPPQLGSYLIPTSVVLIAAVALTVALRKRKKAK